MARPSPPLYYRELTKQRSKSFNPSTTTDVGRPPRSKSSGNVDNNNQVDQPKTPTNGHLNGRHDTSVSIPTISEKVQPRKSTVKNFHRASIWSFAFETTESPVRALKQLIFPFLVAGMGNVTAGVLLDNVQKWDSFVGLPQLIILVPALLGLKGNVEMTLASRLSTHANLGHLDHRAAVKSFVTGNLALVQCQATTVGSIAPFFAILLGMANGLTHITGTNILLIVASSVLTTGLASLFDGVIMCSVVVACRRFGINPDNIATPIAASLGDITELGLLAIIGEFFYQHRENHLWMPIVALSILVVLIPVWASIARTNYHTRDVVLSGWVPIVSAMLLQESGGAVMEKALESFDRLAEFQPVVNGLGGNLASIQSSRLSTWLHMNLEKGQLPRTLGKVCTFPGANFLGRDDHPKMARILLMITIPTHLLFLVIIRFWVQHSLLTFSFVAIYLAAVFFQVATLLYIAHVMVLKMWQKKLNPDNFALPFITAIADLLGSLVMMLAFFLLKSIGDPNATPEEGESFATTLFPNTTVNLIT